jgi:hypothetical protein
MGGACSPLRCPWSIMDWCSVHSQATPPGYTDKLHPKSWGVDQVWGTDHGKIGKCCNYANWRFPLQHSEQALAGRRRPRTPTAQTETPPCCTPAPHPYAALPYYTLARPAWIPLLSQSFTSLFLILLFSVVARTSLVGNLVLNAVRVWRVRA